VNRPRTVAIIQARMGSTRLPGKVLLDLAGQPMLARVVERVRHARLVDEVLVATTTDAGDEAIAGLCVARDYPVHRGSVQDVLDRYYQAARSAGAGVVVRITADCPVIDPALIDATLSTLQEQAADLAATRLPPPWKRTYPIGLDVEACTFSALERAWKEASASFQREHVMPYLYEGVAPLAVTPQLAMGTSQNGFRVVQLNHEPDHGSLRWTVDTPEDLELLRHIYAHFEGRDDFTWQDVLAFYESDPALRRINAGVRHKNVYEAEARK
jgi:spore coat polysaccharide biosynthesis protein SpsF